MFAIVDDEDFDELNKRRWHSRGDKKNGYYAGSSFNLNLGNHKQITLLMHRILMNVPEDMVIDHINHNGLDNRKKNLRVCTQQENARNKKVFNNNKCGLKGVSLKYVSKKNGGKRWVATICVNGKQRRLGYYDSMENAAFAYNKAAKYFFGEYAYKKV